VDSTQLIVELAKQIEAQQAAHQVWFWLLIGAVSLVAGAVGSFISAYFNKRGETRGIQADLKTIIAQQRELTGAVKKVEFDLSHEEWKKRELTTLRREKLEELLIAAGGCADWAIENAQNLLGRGIVSTQANPIAIVNSLAPAFVPELVFETMRLFACQTVLVQTARREQLRRIAAAETKLPISAVADEHVQLLHRLVLGQVNVVVTEGAVIMSGLLGAEAIPTWDRKSMRDNAVKELREFMKVHGLGEPDPFLYTFDKGFDAATLAAARLRQGEVGTV
jgi:hypothetical protein